MSDPATLEDAIRVISSLRNVIQLKSRSITWLENRLISVERALAELTPKVEALASERDILRAKVDVYATQNDRLSERIFMCENVPSNS